MGVQLSLGEEILRGGGMIAGSDPLISNQACVNSGEPEQLQVLQGGMWSGNVGERVGISEAPDKILVITKPQAGSRPTGDQGAFTIVLEVNGHREAVLPYLKEELDQGERTLEASRGAKLSPVQGPDLVDRLESLRDERVLLRDEEDDFRIGEVVPEAVDGGERENNVPDAFPADDEDAFREHAVHIRSCARYWLGGRPISNLKTTLRLATCTKPAFSTIWAKER